MILLEKTEKYYFQTEEDAEAFVESQKEVEGQLVDWKISIKETTKEFYVLATIKLRYKTLAEAKAS